MKKKIFKRISYFLWMVVAFLAVVDSVNAGRKNKEISWQTASHEVDSFPFSAAYIDSLRDTLHCSLPDSPLRRLKTNSIFYPETLVYSISWGPFNAGYVVLTTLHDSSTNTVKIGARALSNNFVSTFYRMRDHILSTVDADGLYPLFFEQHLREGKKYKSEEYLLFNHSKYTIYVKTRKHFKKVKSDQAPIHDYLSVLYYIRATKRLAPGDTFSEVLFVHNKVHSIFFSVHSSEPKEVPVGTFPVKLLVPRLAGEGRAFNKKDKLEIWMSDDEQSIPIAIKSKIKFGSIKARLIWHNKKSTK